MELFQILDCSGTLGTCCTDLGLVGIFSVARRVLGLIQFIVPIALVVAGTIQFVQLTINPELKDGFRRVLNKIIAAIIVFMIPVLVDVILGTVTPDFTVASCWRQTKSVDVGSVFSKGTYSPTPSDENSVWLDPIDFNTISNMGAPKTASSRQKEIVAYASKFIGKEYKYGGYWNGEEPYTPTDCSGFVTGVFHHFGINLPRGVNMFGYNTSLYTEVSESELEPGDVIMYNGHVGIYTGNGKEIIHAASTKLGVIKSSDYSRCSSKEILGFLRIKGVK